MIYQIHIELCNIVFHNVENNLPVLCTVSEAG